MTYLTGYAELDNNILGLEDGKVYSISSNNPTLSRSLLVNLMLNITEIDYKNVNRCDKALFISFSNDKEKIEERMISILSGVYYSSNTKETLRKKDRKLIELAKLTKMNHDCVIKSGIESMDELLNIISIEVAGAIFIDSLEDMMSTLGLKMDKAQEVIDSIKERTPSPLVISSQIAVVEDSRKRKVKLSKIGDRLLKTFDTILILDSAKFESHFEKRTETVNVIVLKDSIKDFKSFYLEYDSTSERFIPSSLESEFVQSFLEATEYYIEELSRYMEVMLFYDFLALSERLDPNGMLYLSYNFSLNAFELEKEDERSECMLIGLKWFFLAINRLDDLRKSGEIGNRSIDWSLFDTVLDSYVSTLSSLNYKKDFDSIYVKIRSVLGENKKVGELLLRRSVRLSEYSKVLYLTCHIHSVFLNRLSLKDIRYAYKIESVHRNFKAKFSLVEYNNELASFFYSNGDYEMAVNCWRNSLSIDEFDKTANYNLYLFYRQDMGIRRSSSEVRGFYERYLRAISA